MSILDKVVAAVTPPESDDARREAREKARSAARPGDWLSSILQHHEMIESAFAEVRAATDPQQRIAAHKRLALILTGHSIAEEAVIYPALARADEKGHSTKAYTEQSAAKAQLGLLGNLPPMSQDYLDKLEHIRGAVLHHVYEEEGDWFVDLRQKLGEDEQALLTERYLEEFNRYMGDDVPSAAGIVPRPRGASIGNAASPTAR
ncbi:MAG: hemerythrin domain-containing protein [Steroidobacteraceae bacterium]|jgi:hemerythrin superfamily protein|nr:hemerythrin domain-containing protein [Steroidobacteraceae bacterium]